MTSNLPYHFNELYVWIAMYISMAINFIMLAFLVYLIYHLYQ